MFVLYLSFGHFSCCPLYLVKPAMSQSSSDQASFLFFKDQKIYVYSLQGMCPLKAPQKGVDTPAAVTCLFAVPVVKKVKSRVDFKEETNKIHPFLHLGRESEVCISPPPFVLFYLLCLFPYFLPTGNPEWHASFYLHNNPVR